MVTTASSVTITFAAVTGASSYDVRVLDKQINGNVVGSGSLSDATKSVVISGLQAKTKYYYEATVTVAGVTSLPTVDSFTTDDNSLTDVEKVGGDIPKEIHLSQNYPNPFNPSTKIEFSIPASTRVRISIYNTLGVLVHELVDGNYSPGRYLVTWDAAAFPSGTYFCHIQTKDYSDTKRMILLK